MFLNLEILGFNISRTTHSTTIIIYLRQFLLLSLSIIKFKTITFKTNQSYSCCKQISLFCFLRVAVPPHKIVIVDDSGIARNSMVGPYVEGDTLRLYCDVYGGEYDV